MRIRVPALAVIGGLAACGARSELTGPHDDVGAGAGGASSSTGVTASSTGGVTTGSTSTGSGGGGGLPVACEPVLCTDDLVRSFSARGSSGGYLGHLSAVAGDPCSGRIAMTGVAERDFDFDGHSVSNDLFVAQLDASGQTRWARELWPKVLPVVSVVAAGSEGSVVVAGRADDYFSIDDLEASNHGGTDAIVLVLDGDGKATWLGDFGTEKYELVTAVAIDRSGRVIVAGRQAGGIDLGGGALPGSAFVGAFSRSGAHLWSHGLGDVQVRSIAADDDGEAYLTGAFEGEMSVAGGATLIASGADVFVARFSAEGAHVASAKYGDAEDQSAEHIAVTAQGKLVIAGRFEGQIDFGSGPITSGVSPGAHFHFWAELERDLSVGQVIALPPGFGLEFEVALDAGGGSRVGYDTSVRSLDAEGSVVDTITFDTGFGTPRLASVPGGVVFASMTAYPVDTFSAPIEGDSLFVARLCSAP